MIVNPELTKPKCISCGKVLAVNEFIYCSSCEAKKKEISNS